MTKKSQSKIVTVLKIIVLLLIISFFLSIMVSLFVGTDIENLDGNVAVIEITGPIVSKGSDSLFSADLSSADSINKMIRKANNDASIDAIVFEINSPGGSAVASDEIASEIKKINKTTIAWIREVGASGGYWIASSTDHIVANRMSITGSIGVIASYVGFAGLMNDHNITYERLVSGKYKDMGSPFRDLSDEERELFQESLDLIHDYFIDEIAENRDMRKRDVEKLATGEIYLGIRAKELGLVDELGSRDEVIAYLEDEIGHVDFVKYKVRSSFLGSLGDVMANQGFYMGKGLGEALLDDDIQTVKITT